MESKDSNYVMMAASIDRLCSKDVIEEIPNEEPFSPNNMEMILKVDLQLTA